MIDVLEDTKVKARKVHRCCWCEESIEKGEAYRRIVLLQDGTFWRQKYHVECGQAMASEVNDGADPEDMPIDKRNRGKTWEETYD